MMGVPDSFWLPENYNDAYRAMGDGVAVPVVRWLGQHLLTPLAKTFPQMLSMTSTIAIAQPQRERVAIHLMARVGNGGSK